MALPAVGQNHQDHHVGTVVAGGVGKLAQYLKKEMNMSFAERACHQNILPASAFEYINENKNVE